MPIKGPDFPSGTWNLRSAMATLDTYYPHAATRREQAYLDRMTYGTKPLRCIGVPDGDGLTIAHPDQRRLTTQVRLIGIDAPEMHGKNGLPEPWAHESKADLAEAAIGRNIRLKIHPSKTRCKFGRLLAIAIIDDYPMTLNERQVWLGNAFFYPDFPFPDTESLPILQAAARHAKRGLWKALRFGDLPRWAQKRERHRPSDPPIPRGPV